MKNKTKLDPLSPPFLISVHFFLEIVFVFVFASYAIYINPSYLVGREAYYDFMVIGFILSVIYLSLWLLSFRLSGGSWRYFKSKKEYIKILPAGLSLPIGLILFITVIIMFFTSIIIVLNPNLGEGPRSNLIKGAYGKIMFAMIAASAVSFWISCTLILSRVRMNDSIFIVSLFLVTAIIYSLVLWQLGGRARALELFIGLVFIYHYTVKNLSFRFIGISAFILLFTAFILSGQIQNITSGNFSFFAVMFGFEGGRNFDALYNLSAILFHFSEKNPLLGSGMINGVLSDLGTQFSDTTREKFMRTVFGVDEVFFGVTPTKIGEAYINFGASGVIIMPILMGILAAKAQVFSVKYHIFGPASVVVYYAVQWRMGASNIAIYFGENFVNPAFYIFCALLFLFLFKGYYRIRMRIRFRTSEV